MWQKFLEWLYKTHAVTKDWTPDKTSIQVWEEFRSSKVDGKDTPRKI